MLFRSINKLIHRMHDTYQHDCFLLKLFLLLLTFDLFKKNLVIFFVLIKIECIYVDIKFLVNMSFSYLIAKKICIFTCYTRKLGALRTETKRIYCC